MTRRAHPSIAVGALGTASAIEIAETQSGRSTRFRFSSASPEFKIVQLSDVLYAPSVLETGQSLQVLEGRYLPVEAVFDGFTAEFVRSALLGRGVTSIEAFADDEDARPVCILGNVFSRNFCHWHEELMKVVVMEAAGAGCVYIISDLPAFARELLTLVGVSEGRIREVRRPTRFRTAMYGTPVSYRNASEYPEVLLALRGLLLGAVPRPASQSGQRLWLDRSAQTRLGRRLVNEEEVHRLLEKHGFERVDMGGLPIREQIAIAGNMRALSGLHGAQFVHSQLMPERSHVIECFSPLYLNPTYTEVYRVLRHRYSQLTATNAPLFPYAHGTDVLVDCQQLDLALGEAAGGH